MTPLEHAKQYQADMRELRAIDRLADQFISAQEVKEAMSTDPRDGGCKCQQCGRLYKMDIILPDDEWEFFGQRKLVCPTCIVLRLEEQYGFCAFKMRQV